MTPTPTTWILRHGSGYKGVRFTAHGLLRLEQMGLRLDDVIDAVTWPQIEREGGPGRSHLKMASRGKVTVVYDPKPAVKIVVTILPWTQDRYERPKGE